MTNKAVRLERLRAADGPPARAAVAVELLEARYGREVVQAALHALIACPDPAARPALLRLYAHYAADGVGRDPGTYLRSQIVRALRPLVLPDDLPLLVQATACYEYPPPSFTEEAGLLRAGALVALADLDEHAARYQAARLLVDDRTDPMSGQPALVAVELLAALDETLPLWSYALQPQPRAEIAAECLRRLTALPTVALASLLAHYAECTQPVLLVGLVDLLIGHPDGALGQPWLARLLQRPPDLDLYRYVVAALLAAGRADLRGLVAEAARLETHPARVAVLLEAIEGAGLGEEWRELAARLAGRRKPRR